MNRVIRLGWFELILFIVIFLATKQKANLSAVDRLAFVSLLYNQLFENICKQIFK